MVPQSEIMRIISCVLLSQHIQRKQVDNTIKILNHIMSIYKLLTNWIQRVPVTDTGPQQTLLSNLWITNYKQIHIAGDSSCLPLILRI